MSDQDEDRNRVLGVIVVPLTVAVTAILGWIATRIALWLSK